MSTYVSWRMDDHLHEGDLQTLSLIQSWDWLDLRRSAGCPTASREVVYGDGRSGLHLNVCIVYEEQQSGIARAKRIGA